MADIQTVEQVEQIIQTAEPIIKWGVNGFTILLMVIASSMAIKKKNNPALLVAIFGNIGVYYLTQSPLLCWIVSVGCMIWVKMTKVKEEKVNVGTKADIEVSRGKSKSNVAAAGKVRCRYCKKMYDSDYNGCPFCKKV